MRKILKEMGEQVMEGLLDFPIFLSTLRAIPFLYGMSAIQARFIGS